MAEQKPSKTWKRDEGGGGEDERPSLDISESGHPPPLYEGPSASSLQGEGSSDSATQRGGTGATVPQMPTQPRTGFGRKATTTSSTTTKGTPARRGAQQTASGPDELRGPVRSRTFTPAAAPATPQVPEAPTTTAPTPGGGDGRDTTPTSPVPQRKIKRPSGSLARRLLEVTVVEAAGLLGTDKGGVSNPRVDILLVDLAGRVVKTEGVKQTPVKNRTVSPVWNHKVVFGNRANLSSASNNLPTLRLQVRMTALKGSAVLNEVGTGRNLMNGCILSCILVVRTNPSLKLTTSC